MQWQNRQNMRQETRDKDFQYWNWIEQDVSKVRGVNIWRVQNRISMLVSLTRRSYTWIRYKFVTSIQYFQFSFSFLVSPTFNIVTKWIKMKFPFWGKIIWHFPFHFHTHIRADKIFISWEAHSSRKYYTSYTNDERWHEWLERWWWCIIVKYSNSYESCAVYDIHWICQNIYTT